MNKRTFYLTLTFSIVILVGVGLAIMRINSTAPESEEGALMYYTCEDVKAYETFAAENDLEELQAVIRTHINDYPAETANRLTEAMAELDSLRDEAAFRNTDQSLYKSHFRNVLRTITYAELAQAEAYLADQQTDAANESIRHAQHCLHDALLFSSEAEVQADQVLLQELNTLSNEGATASGLEKVMGKL